MDRRTPHLIRLMVTAALTCAGVSVAALAQAPPEAEAVPVGVQLRRAAPDVSWSPEGLLVYSVSQGDSTSFRTLDPRTGVDRPYVPPRARTARSRASSAPGSSPTDRPCVRCPPPIIAGSPAPRTPTSW